MFSLFPEKRRIAGLHENKKSENLLPAAFCGLAKSKEKC